MRYISCRNNRVFIDATRICTEYKFDTIKLKIDDSVEYEGELVDKINLDKSIYDSKQIIKLYLIINGDAYYLDKTNFSYPKWNYDIDNYKKTIEKFNQIIERY